MAVEMPSGCGKTELIFKMLSGNTLYPNLTTLFSLQRNATDIRQNGDNT